MMSHATGGADEFAAAPGLTPSSRAPDGELDTIHEARSKRRRLTTVSFTRRKRAATACQFCRLRKTKCDTARPTCGFCRYHQAKCVYDDNGKEDDLSSGANASLSNYVVELGEQVLSNLGELEQMLRQPQQHDHPQQQQVSTPIACSFTNASASRPTIWAGGTDESYPPPVPVLLPQPQSPSCSPYTATRCESILRWPIFKRTIEQGGAKIQSFLFESDTAAALPDYALPHASGTSLMPEISHSCASLFGQDDGAAAGAYYEAAKKRIGLLRSSTIDMQCLFFASIFERYSLRPVNAWFYIQMACTRLQMHLMRKNRRKYGA
ncbi:hypothetical protein DL764_006282 [Monosporascus ibericus]|uniref:Zn(2)-C6 fungal-type domain-containing protein n=1 Tax=Monosporascus ibericus TaxID=155417 RepID=A0A4Q4T8B2_9PEZI|nr:hypothetical protein DL764_006282 [Monosporascus ibericus]